MTMNRTQLIAQVKLNIGNRTDLDSRIDEWLDWSIEDIASVRNWRSMKVWDTDTLKTREGGMHYSLPPLVKDFLRVKYIDGSMTRTLRYIDPDHYHRLYPHPETTGNGFPAIYTWEGDYLEIYPLASVSNKPIHMFIAKWPPPFDDDANLCPFDRLDKVVVARASYYAHQALDNLIRKREFEIEFLQGVKIAGRIDGNPTDWTPKYASIRMSGYRTRDYLSVPPEG